MILALQFPGGWELILIFLVVLLLFGAKRIPEIARGLGRGIREFKDATDDVKKELTMADKPSQPVQPPAQQPAEAASSQQQSESQEERSSEAS